MRAFTSVRIACSRASPAAMRLSTAALNSQSWSATAALRAIIAEAQLAEEPTARNSKRLPVKANGEVRFRSVLSRRISGICDRPSCICSLPAKLISSSLVLFSSLSRISESCVPRNIEMIAGGASLAPRRCWLVAEEIEALRRPLCL